jgi:hypothetical protein
MDRGLVRMGVEAWNYYKVFFAPPFYPHPGLPPAKGKEKSGST